MKNLLTILSILSIIQSTYCQEGNKVLRQELLGSLLVPSDSIYISDRKQLENISGSDCFENTLIFIYKSISGDKIEIIIEQGLFNPSKHKLHLVDTIYKNVNGKKGVDYLIAVNLIDDRLSYGIDGDLPKIEIKSITIKWNGQKLAIPDTAYSNLYEPHLCLDYLPIEAYLTKKLNLYLYIAGSDAAGGYSVKLVFDKTKYLTRIVGTNEMTDGFDFLDGTAKIED